jgi:superfamily I DNA and/or RNA helicase
VYRVFNAQWRELSALASPHTQTFSPLSSGALTYMQALFADWAQEKNQLQPWCVWQQKKSKAHEHGLEGLVASLESGEVQLSELQDFFDYSYKDWWVKKIFDKEPLLSEFSGATHQYKINEFKKLDEQFHLLTQRYIVAKLRGHMPDDVEQTSKLSTEIKFLRHQAQLKTRHKPIRTLMSETTGLLSRVKPCLLMSPLSVAQYLDAAHAQFDVVIFDEASQIPTWDAVGAIARGKQFICVGDPKQLPPTGFFSSGESDNASDNENLEEMESVLDECLSMGMSISTLDWHYRSKSEGLITF